LGFGWLVLIFFRLYDEIVVKCPVVVAVREFVVDKTPCILEGLKFFPAKACVSGPVDYFKHIELLIVFGFTCTGAFGDGEHKVIDELKASQRGLNKALERLGLVVSTTSPQLRLG
jgi:hypothetical protein